MWGKRIFVLMTLNQRKRLPRWLLVCGNGRHVGKSMLAERLVRDHHVDHSIVALKISPHQHYGQDVVLVSEGEGYAIYHEVGPNRTDSGRFLAAGALSSFYMECKDEYLERAVETLQGLINPGAPVVCESGRLGEVFEPDLMVFINTPGKVVSPSKEVLSELSNIHISGEADIEVFARKVRLRRTGWHFV